MYFIRSRSVVLETATANNVVLFIRSLSTALVTPGMSASGKMLCARKKTSLLYPGRFPLVEVNTSVSRKVSAELALLEPPVYWAAATWTWNEKTALYSFLWNSPKSYPVCALYYLQLTLKCLRWVPGDPRTCFSRFWPTFIFLKITVFLEFLGQRVFKRNLKYSDEKMLLFLS